MRRDQSKHATVLVVVMAWLVNEILKTTTSYRARLKQRPAFSLPRPLCRPSMSQEFAKACAQRTSEQLGSSAVWLDGVSLERARPSSPPERKSPPVREMLGAQSRVACRHDRDSSLTIAAAAGRPAKETYASRCLRTQAFLPGSCLRSLWRNSSTITQNAPYFWGNFHACATTIIISKTATAGPGAGADSTACSSIITCAAVPDLSSQRSVASCG